MDKPTENALAIVGTSKVRQGKSAADAPLPMDEPAMGASAEPITIDLTAIETRMEPPRHEAMDGDGGARSASGKNDGRWEKFTPLAASLVLATLAGAFAGAAATYGLSGNAFATAHAPIAISDETRALRETVTNLSSELAVLKSGIESASRTAASQLGKIGERLERAEKAQIEPAAKLAKIAESLDRLERRTASADVTGSVTSIEKQQAKPATVEGWRLLDYYAGRAVLESRNGTLFEVGPGANLPGVGRIETIKRVDGKIVVTTPKGVIVSALQQPQPQRRPPPYYLPRGY